jgi:hypothetical protein
MKKILSISVLFTLVLILVGCQTTEEDHAGLRGKGVMTLMSDLNPGIFIAKDGNSFVKFVVALPEGESVDQAEVQVCLAGNSERFKVDDIATFPATITITLSDVAAALGTTVAAIPEGSTIYVEVVTTKDGLQTRSAKAAVAIGVVCNFNQDLTTGSYHSVSPATDWASEGDITLTADGSDPYKIYVTGIEAIEGQTEVGPLVMHINPATFAVVADKSIIVALAFGSYHNLYYQGTGTYNSCSGKYTMSFAIGCDEGSFGTNAFTFTRNSSK